MFYRRKKQKLASESGQAIIEFLIVSTMILTLIFVFVQLAWGIAFGHYAHYATFMASRAYLSSGLTKQDQYDAAVKVLQTSLKTAAGKDLLPFVAKARTGDERDVKGSEPVPGAALGTHSEALGKDKSRKYSWAEGVQFNFGLRLFLLPLSSVITKSGEGKTIQAGSATQPAKGIEWKGSIPFASDSFLGREPTVDECFKEMTRISTSIGINRADNADFIEDNGC
jgi:hypothetical protein